MKLALAILTIVPIVWKLIQKYIPSINLDGDFYEFANKIEAESPCPLITKIKAENGIFYTCQLRNSLAKHKKINSIYSLDELKFTKQCTLKQYRKCRLTDNYGTPIEK